ncbi:MAG: hypothetical protein JXA21_27900 [Anaerolineae bacterium]|nr:hypothetical protein [Anaerolineae bacterium]
MNKRWMWVGVGLLAALFLANIAGAQSSASYDFSWHVLAGGGERAASTNYAMDGTLGQAVVGLSDGALYGMSSGYWQNWPDTHVVFLPLILKGS